MMATMYDVGTNTITYHIKKLFDDSELQEDSAIRKFRIAAPDGKSYNTNNYSLEMIIAVGYILPLATKPRMSLRSYILILYDSFLFSVYYIDCGPVT